MICTVPTIYVLLACSLLTVQAQQHQADAAPGAANNNMAAALQNMINYFNEHPFKDASGRPSQAFQSMLQQMQSSDSSNANTPTNSAVDIALPAIPPTVADVVLPSAPPINAPADIPIALAAGVPASVAAAAAVPHNQPAITTPQDNVVVVSSESALKQNPPISPAVVPPAVIPQTPNVVPEAPPVVPQTPNVVPEAPPVVPQAPNVVPATEPSAIVAPVPINAPLHPSVVPVSTIYASESSTVPPTQPASTASQVPTTGTTMMTRTNAMSTATLSASRSIVSSVSRSASASATSSIPPISASSSLRLADGVLLSMGLGLIVVIITMISPFNPWWT